MGFDFPSGWEPETLHGPDLLAFADIAPVEAPSLPLELQIAEKVHAYTRGYGQSGMASTRVKDLVDLALIASAAPLNADRLSRALRETFGRRDRHELPGVHGPDAFNWRRSVMIIAIDGPAASGKGTLGKRLAAHYGLRHLDTGLLYRAVALAMLDGGHSLQDNARAAAAAMALDPSRFDETALKSPEVGEAASIVSAIPEVRAALFNFQQEFAAAPPGAVLDGRDIGTVICPNADVKIFVIASPEARAKRRFLELKAQGQMVNESEILADILKRDERDTTRAAAPLMRAPDAHLLDTTHLDIDAAVRAAVDIVEAARAR